MDLSGLEQLVMSYPITAAVFSFLYLASIAFKVLSTAAQSYVDSTADVKDNEILLSVEKSQVYKSIAFVADLVLRIKPPAKKEVVKVEK